MIILMMMTMAIPPAFIWSHFLVITRSFLYHSSGFQLQFSELAEVFLWDDSVIILDTHVFQPIYDLQYLKLA